VEGGHAQFQGRLDVNLDIVADHGGFPGVSLGDLEGPSPVWRDDRREVGPQAQNLQFSEVDFPDGFSFCSEVQKRLTPRKAGG